MSGRRSITAKYCAEIDFGSMTRLSCRDGTSWRFTIGSVLLCTLEAILTSRQNKKRHGQMRAVTRALHSVVDLCALSQNIPVASCHCSIVGGNVEPSARVASMTLALTCLRDGSLWRPIEYRSVGTRLMLLFKGRSKKDYRALPKKSHDRAEEVRHQAMLARRRRLRK